MSTIHTRKAHRHGWNLICSEIVLQELGLGRFAAAVDAFEHDERASFYDAHGVSCELSSAY